MISSTFAIDVMGDNFSKIESSTKLLKKILKENQRIDNPKIVTNKGKPEAKISIDKDKMASYGLSLQQVAEHIRASIKGEYAGIFYKHDDQFDITVRLQKRFRKDVSHLNDILIKGEKINNIPLKSFASVEIQSGYSKIFRKNQQRYISIQCDSSADIGSLFEEIEGIIRTTVLPADTEAHISEEIIAVKDSIKSLILSLILSVVLIYMILASQFESFIKPALIMVTVPLTLSGTSLALLLTANSLNVMSIMGMILLSGIVVNNAIVLLEYITQYRQSGHPLAEAIVLGSSERLRPILMTTLTTILGLVPLAIGLQEGGEIQSPMAITVIGGLMVSTVLTLIILPIFYYKLEQKNTIVEQAE